MNVENVSTSVASAQSLTPKARQPEPAADAKAREQVDTTAKEEARKDASKIVDITV